MWLNGADHCPGGYSLRYTTQWPDFLDLPTHGRTLNQHPDQYQVPPTCSCSKYHVCASSGMCSEECYGLLDNSESGRKQKTNRTTLVSLPPDLCGQTGGLVSLQETAARAAKLLPWQQRLGLGGHCSRRLVTLTPRQLQHARTSYVFLQRTPHAALELPQPSWTSP